MSEENQERTKEEIAANVKIKLAEVKRVQAEIEKTKAEARKAAAEAARGCNGCQASATGACIHKSKLQARSHMLDSQNRAYIKSMDPLLSKSVSILGK